MIYNVEWVETESECDLLISSTDDDISELQADLTDLQQKQKLIGKVSDDSKSEYEVNLNDLAGLNASIPSLSEGKAKKEKIKEQKRLEYRQALLEDRKESYNNVAKAENQRMQGRIQVQIAELNVFRAAIVTRKGVLAGAGA